MKAIEVTILFFFSLSISLMLFICLVYVKFGLSTKHPNNLFFNVIILQLLENVMTITCILMLNSFPSYVLIEGDLNIVIMLYIIRFLRLLIFHFIIIMCAEILIKFKKKLVLKNQTRVILLKIYSFVMAGVFTIFGRSSSDIIQSYIYGNLIYMMYTFIFCTLFIWFIFYLSFAKIKKVKSQNLNVLMILTVLQVLITVLQTLSYLLLKSKMESKSFDEASYFIVSFQGFLVFLVMLKSQSMRQYMKETILCKSIKISTENVADKTLEDELVISLMQSPKDIKIPGNESGLFSDTFENITKHVTLK